MTSQYQKPELLYLMQQSMLGLSSILKDFHEVISEKNELRANVKKFDWYLNELQDQRADMQTHLDQYEIHLGKLNNEAAVIHEQITTLTSLLKSKKDFVGDQVCSESQEEARDSELEMKRLKEQLQQRDSEIVNWKQENETLSAEVARLQKAEALWNEAAHREMVEQGMLAVEEENKKLLDEHREVFKEEEKKFNEEKQLEEAKKGLHGQHQECQKVSQALKELTEVQKDTQEKKTDTAELIKTQQETMNLLEVINLQLGESDIDKDSNEIKKLLKQKDKIEKKLLKAREKELENQVKKREEEERKQQKIQEKEAKKEQKRQEKEAKKLKRQEQNENRRRGIWSWFCCSAPPED